MSMANVLFTVILSLIIFLWESEDTVIKYVYFTNESFSKFSVNVYLLFLLIVSNVHQS